MKNDRNKHLDFQIIDTICLLAPFYVFYVLKVGGLFINSFYFIVLICMLIAKIITAFFLEIYDEVLYRDWLKELKITFAYCLLNFAIIIIGLFAFKVGQVASRILVVGTYGFYFVFSYLSRCIYRKYLRNKSYDSLRNGEKSLLVICSFEEAEEVVKIVTSNNYEFYKIDGLCIIDKRMIGKKIDSYKVVANKDTIEKYISTNWVDAIYIGCDVEKIPANIIGSLENTGIPIHVRIANIDAFSGAEQNVNKLGGQYVLTISSKSKKRWEIVIKKVIDIVGGLIGSIITVLLTIVIGPIIYFKSKGPIFYVSERVGKNGRIFKFYKFRSMIINADIMKEELQSKNKIKDGMMFKIENDPRIIPGIGTFIRKTNIDEFPQFFNVLKGDMSLVGTRPPTIEEWKKYTPSYRSRLSIKPGITGLWQVSGRSNITDFNEVVKLDQDYIKYWSVGMDIRIIVKTIFIIFDKKNRGSY